METHWNFNSFNLVNLIYSANIKCDNYMIEKLWMHTISYTLIIDL